MAAKSGNRAKRRVRDAARTGQYRKRGETNAGDRNDSTGQSQIASAATEAAPGKGAHHCIVSEIEMVFVEWMQWIQSAELSLRVQVDARGSDAAQTVT